MEETRHYLLNWQWQKKGRVIRAEVFYKDYLNLCSATNLTSFNNTFGKQYSQSSDSSGSFTGLDVKPNYQAQGIYFSVWDILHTEEK